MADERTGAFSNISDAKWMPLELSEGSIVQMAEIVKSILLSDEFLEAFAEKFANMPFPDTITEVPAHAIRAEK